MKITVQQLADRLKSLKSRIPGCEEVDDPIIDGAEVSCGFRTWDSTIFKDNSNAEDEDNDWPTLIGREIIMNIVKSEFKNCENVGGFDVSPDEKFWFTIYCSIV